MQETEIKEQPVEETLNSETNDNNNDSIDNIVEEAPEKEVSPEEQLEQLKQFRKNGSVTLEMTHSQFKKMRNVFKNDISWKGPNQAYLLSILMLNLEQALSSMDPKEENEQRVALRNDSIEAMSVFVNSIEGKSSHSATLSLGMFLSIQQAISQLQSVDSQINSLENSLKSTKEK